MVDLYFAVYSLICKSLNIPVTYLGRQWVLSSALFRDRKWINTCWTLAIVLWWALPMWYRYYPHFWGLESLSNLPKVMRLGIGTLRFQAQSFLITEPEFFDQCFSNCGVQKLAFWSKWVCQNAGFLVPPEIHWTRVSRENGGRRSPQTFI